MVEIILDLHVSVHGHHSETYWNTAAAITKLSIDTNICRKYLIMAATKKKKTIDKMMQAAYSVPSNKTPEF